MTAFLILEDGSSYQGIWHGGEDRAGEVVFNTSHSGYEEIATDPSYYSQIVVMTAPMMGNYGVDPATWESGRIWIEGFICLQLQDTAGDHAWKDLLIKNLVPIVSEFDTRKLVIRLRSGGTPWGALVQAENLEQAKKKAEGLIQSKKKKSEDWVYEASRKEVELRKGEGFVGPRIAVLDFGCKENILRELSRHSSELCIFPSRSSAKDLQAIHQDFWADWGLMLLFSRLVKNLHIL